MAVDEEVVDDMNAGELPNGVRKEQGAKIFVGRIFL
jgi:hypothetical protein